MQASNSLVVGRVIGRFVQLGALLTVLALVIVAGAKSAQAQQARGAEYERATSGTRWLEGGGGFAIKMLVEESNLGGDEVELGEITFPVGAGRDGRSHVHGRVEIFYILSGELDHVVNGESHILRPGMVGIVRPGDSVVHHVVSDVPVKALVIWAPGGEADRIASFFQERPINRN